MNNLEPSFLSQGIQLALAPVFLLTAVATLVSALTSRLSRVVDRSRFLQGLLKDEIHPHYDKEDYRKELGHLALRGKLINVSMALVVFCGLSIGLTVLGLFVSETASGRLQLSHVVLNTFVVGIGSFVLSLLCLLIEVFVASYSIRYKES
ncbi:DUF2721 domain-containing protein [Ferrovum sp. PN-J185]|jgi:hypothetical protein|uniref:DUF2721 domain-containing protein n=1 Tax=Ferrovum sp. PN-J185 TaxID=1356306 RepID=UPI000795B8E4|nr:DUF2721 domain-containing protein [Ferrovum sp. PN-J185]KXW55244.1 hypothetical protein FV185_17580 [Ferrovum sp. PN-J185]MCC6068059.1 DUF2721 domain-containing protein [Ferrovum sp. PN-J185]